MRVKQTSLSNLKFQKNTVSTILKNAKSIIEKMENSDVCSGNRLMKKGMYQKVDEAILEWFKTVRQQNLPISGVIIKQKALEFTTKLNETNFKASTGWLDN